MGPEAMFQLGVLLGGLGLALALGLIAYRYFN